MSSCSAIFDSLTKPFTLCPVATPPGGIAISTNDVVDRCTQCSQCIFTNPLNRLDRGVCHFSPASGSASGSSRTINFVPLPDQSDPAQNYDHPYHLKCLVGNLKESKTCGECGDKVANADTLIHAASSMSKECGLRTERPSPLAGAAGAPEPEQAPADPDVDIQVVATPGADIQGVAIPDGDMQAVVIPRNGILEYGRGLSMYPEHLHPFRPDHNPYAYVPPEITPLTSCEKKVLALFAALILGCLSPVFVYLKAKGDI